jgi:hypothetical protein
LLSSYSFIDASAGDYQEEEGYLEEEEENFDNYPNLGKLIFLQVALVQSSTRARHPYLVLYA